MGDRLGKFSLELAIEKTRCIEFGRCARENARKRRQKPEEFTFLGFTLTSIEYWPTDIFSPAGLPSDGRGRTFMVSASVVRFTGVLGSEKKNESLKKSSKTERDRGRCRELGTVHRNIAGPT